MDLIVYAREVVGLPMKGLRNGVHIGWTTDKEKAEKMRLAGAVVQHDTDWSNDGYDISFPMMERDPLTGEEIGPTQMIEAVRAYPMDAA